MGNVRSGQENKNDKKPFGGLFGESTPAKASGLAFSLATILPVLLSFVFLIVIGALGLAKTQDYQSKDWYIYANFLLPQLSFVLTLFAFLRYTGTPIKRAWKVQACKPKYFLLAILLQVGLLCLSELNVWFLQLLGGFGYTDGGIALPSMDGFGFIGTLLVVAVFASVTEEIIFRGVLLDGLKKTFNTWTCILLCGTLFAIYHQNPAQTLYQFCCGAAFAWVALRAGSILPTALAHFLNNAYILVLYKAGITVFPKPVFIAVMSVSVLCLVGAVVWLVFFDKYEKTVGENKSNTTEKKYFALYALAGVVICAFTWVSVLLMGL